MSSRRTGFRRTGFGRLGLWTAASLAAACSQSGLPTATSELDCGLLDRAFLADGGVGRDGIPALSDPALAPPGDVAVTGYLSDPDRVIGVEIGGEWIAIPHNIMYRHEIVNLTRGGQRIAVTYCPLTGSALAFDRGPLAGVEFGVSGLLFQANLIMYDRNADDSLWPQMRGEAACGPREGQALDRHPLVEMRWDGWRALHPESGVVAADPADHVSYRINPYGSFYEDPSNPDYLGFPIPRSDTRRLPKERVLGLPGSGGAAGSGAEPPLAFPFHALEARGALWATDFRYRGADAVLLWDRSRVAAVAVRPVANGRRLTLAVDEDAIVDKETGSRWTVTGLATHGPLTGARLPIIPEAYVAFWQAWAAFHPGTELVLE